MGLVSLVGAGPGDPELITLKGLRALEKADIVFYDFLSNPALLSHVPKKAEKIFVGKNSRPLVFEQNRINELLLEAARKGLSVVRLKGGDPFVFGRGGEEAVYLRTHGIPIEIIPGVTSAIAVPAYAGIPLTHRDISPFVAFVTGHGKQSRQYRAADWQAMARMKTLVLLMGVSRLEMISRKLVQHGAKKNTPVAVIQSGTLPAQKTLVASLETVHQKVREAGIQAPAVIVVGKIVRLRDSLSWYEPRPLFGKTILVTRPRHQNQSLVEKLSAQGASVLELPVLTMTAPENWREVDVLIREGKREDVLIFTSSNAARFFLQRITEKQASCLRGVRVAVIGQATAKTVKSLGWSVDFICEKSDGSGFVEFLSRKIPQRTRLLFPHGSSYNEEIPKKLTKAGFKVRECVVYLSKKPAGLKQHWERFMKNHHFDALVFTSPLIIRNLVEVTPEKQKESLRKTPTFCIGKPTGKVARECGFLKVSIPQQTSLDALVQKVIDQAPRL